MRNGPVPWNYDFLNKVSDSALLSNGSLHPKMYAETVVHVKRAMEKGYPYELHGQEGQSRNLGSKYTSAAAS